MWLLWRIAYESKLLKKYHKVGWNCFYIQIYSKNTADNILAEKLRNKRMNIYNTVKYEMPLYANTVHLIKYMWRLYQHQMKKYLLFYQCFIIIVKLMPNLKDNFVLFFSPLYNIR